MKLTVLGSGSPEAYARRASAGHLLEVAGRRLLFDCGGGVFDRLLRAGFGPSDIDALFLSHLHSDHMMDYARLVHSRWDEGGPPLRVFGPPPTAAVTEKLFGPDGVFAHDLTARCELPGSKEVWLARGGSLPRPWPKPDVTEIAPGFAMEENGWRLSSCEAFHAQPHLVCMGFRVDADRGSFAYSGDAGITEEMERFVSGADLLLHWCYRTSDREDVSEFMRAAAPTPVEIARMARRAGVGRLVLSHFRQYMDGDGRLEAARRELAENFGPRASVAEDLDSFDMVPS